LRHLSAADVRALHAVALELDGGAPGERDPNGLESAVAQPGLEVFGQPLHPTLEAMAAAYLYHLCQAHAFVDGNKRTALAAMLVFLRINGFRLAASDYDLFQLTLAVARGELGKAMVTDRLRDWLEPHSN
jgi:death-on-curing protein